MELGSYLLIRTYLGTYPLRYLPTYLGTQVRVVFIFGPGLTQIQYLHLPLSSWDFAVYLPTSTYLYFAKMDEKGHHTYGYLGTYHSS